MTGINYEIIIINDGSKDSSEIICKYYLENYASKIVYRCNENKGCSFSRNLGLKIAKGEYICFVDSDDWVDNNYYKELFIFAKKEELDVSIGNINYIDEEDISIIEISAKNIKEKKDLLKNFSLFNSPWNKVIKKDLLEKNKILFLEASHMGEDMAFMYEVYLKSNKIKGIVNNLKYNYLKNPSSVSFNTEKRKEIYLSFEEILNLKQKDKKLFNELFIRNGIYLPLKLCENNRKKQKEYENLINKFEKHFNIKTKIFYQVYKMFLFYKVLKEWRKK